MTNVLLTFPVAFVTCYDVNNKIAFLSHWGNFLCVKKRWHVLPLRIHCCGWYLVSGVLCYWSKWILSWLFSCVIFCVFIIMMKVDIELFPLPLFTESLLELTGNDASGINSSVVAGQLSGKIQISETFNQFFHEIESFFTNLFNC